HVEHLPHAECRTAVYVAKNARYELCNIGVLQLVLSSKARGELGKELLFRRRLALLSMRRFRPLFLTFRDLLAFRLCHYVWVLDERWAKYRILNGTDDNGSV